MAEHCIENSILGMHSFQMSKELPKEVPKIQLNICSRVPDTDVKPEESQPTDKRKTNTIHFDDYHSDKTYAS
jgi:hypothetical protein